MKIADFGLAVYVSDIEQITRLKPVSSFWSAPELTNAYSSADLLSCDIYSAANVFCVMYHGWNKTEYWSTLFPDSAPTDRHPRVSNIRELYLKELIAESLNINPIVRPTTRESIRVLLKKTPQNAPGPVRAAPPTISPRPSVEERQIALASLKLV